MLRRSRTPSTPLLAAVLLLSAGLPVLAEGVTVSGRVLVPGGAALAEARVSLYPMSDALSRAQEIGAGIEPEPVARGLTDAGGRYRLEAPHAGLWTVKVEAKGFAPLVRGLLPLIEPIELPDARLAPDTRLRVKVLGPGGEPVGGAIVAVDDDRGGIAAIRSSGWKTPQRHGTTGPDGTVELARGEGERVVVQAVAPGLAPIEVRGIAGTAATLRPVAGRGETLVVHSAGGTPVPGVLVTAGSPPLPVGVTDAEGVIQLPLGDAVLTELGLLAEDGRRLETRVRPSAPADDGRPATRTLVLPERSIVTGRLIDAESRRAIAGGVVWDPENPLGAVTTERSGGFALSGSSGDRMEMTAGAPGYLQAEGRDFQFDGRPGPTLALHPAAAIEGRVVGPDGEPVEGAEITVKEKQPSGMMRIEFGRGPLEPRNRSNSRGDFRVSPLDPDKNWAVKVRAEGFAPAEVTVRDLEPLRVRRGVDVTLTRGHTVRGRVVDGAGRGIREATVQIEPAPERHGMPGIRLAGGAGPEPVVGSTDDDGRFEIAGLPSGRLDLEANRSGFARSAVEGIEVPADSETFDVGDVTLTPGERLQGLVTDRDGTPLEGVEVFVEESGGGGMVMTFAPMGSSEEPPDTVTDPSGWFDLKDLSVDAKYTLRLGRTGYVDKTVSQLQLPHPEPVEVALQPASDVSGVVLDPAGEPIVGARVTMTRSRTVEMGNNVMKMLMAASDDTDSDGRFLFEDQEPGTISLTAVASGFREAKLDGVEVPEGQDVDDLELPLEGGAVLVGSVRTPDGRPAVEAAVQPIAEGNDRFLRLNATAADGDGRYRLEGLAPGTMSIEATHDDYPRVVRDVELKQGVNSLDFDFEGGVEVSGRVTDTEGKPVPGALVRLLPAGRYWGGPEAESGHDGRFEMPGVQDGDYRLLAQADGYAASDAERTVAVAGQPVQQLEVVLDPGASIVGRVLGLDPQDFREVSVRAEGGSSTGFEGVGVDFEGNFRLDHLGAGTYNVVAELGDSGRRASERVDVASGTPETPVDLQFGAGLTLSGKALQGEKPVAGASVYAEGQDIDHLGWGQTDRDGAFTIEGLEPGTYRVNLRDWSTGLAYGEEHRIDSSRDITLRVPTARIGGTVVDSADRQPLQGVTLTLVSENAGGRGRLPTHTATSDLEGKFEFQSVADGNWKLSASRKGYSAISRSLAVQFERSAGDLRLSMDPTEGLTLEARLPTGAAPNEVSVAVLDPAGGALVSGNYTTGENGRVRLSSVPPGSWTLVVSASGSATQTVQAQAPGPALTVRLQPACSLKLRVPELSGSSALATVTLADSGGRRFHALSWSGQPRSEWRMSDGRMQFGSLPPGSWTVHVAAPDGRTWSASATTAAGAPAEVTLE